MGPGQIGALGHDQIGALEHDQSGALGHDQSGAFERDHGSLGRDQVGTSLGNDKTLLWGGTRCL